MTAPFRRTASCPKCGHAIALADDFLQWVRENPALPSDTVVVTDRDLLVHRFKTSHGRELQCLMSVEVKTCGARVAASQYDSLHIAGQFMRNRRTTPTKRKFKQVDGAPNSVYSALLDRNVKCKAFGFHLLTLDGTTPANSESIIWDTHQIDADILVKILRFELDPDTLRDLDFRIHHKPKAMELGLAIA